MTTRRVVGVSSLRPFGLTASASAILYFDPLFSNATLTSVPRLSMTPYALHRSPSIEPSVTEILGTS